MGTGPEELKHWRNVKSGIKDELQKQRALREMDTSAKSLEKTRLKHQEWADGGGYENIEKFKSELEARQSRPDLKIAENEPVESPKSSFGKFLAASALAESIRPSVAGQGSDQLPDDEQQLKDAYNKKKLMAKAIMQK